MQVAFHSQIDDFRAEEWNRLVKDENPFLRYEFLSALEHNDCVGERFGWQPQHLSVHDQGRLVGVSPLYLKDNSYGEFVFDHVWADAYRRSGLNYYPKLISAAPYTPAYGNRLLVDPAVDKEQVQRVMIEATLGLVKQLKLSSMHWLFTMPEEGETLKRMGMHERLGVQFHWSNPGYSDFDHFLSQLTAKRRKNIRHERRKVAQAGIRFRLVTGDQVSESEWALMTHFYSKTFEERYSLPTLNQGFFQEIGEKMGRQVVLVFAYDGSRCVAGAILYRSRTVLYGRHWGGLEHYDSLHFEACYYQGISYAIEQGLKRFEPGAQGEHKIWRGFMPTLTYSYHWIANPEFNSGIERFLHQEAPALRAYHKNLLESSPYRKETELVNG
ncbi:MAG: GNAT family N-acetyltransferase [Candidatus Thiodiazotropha sp. (ex Ctena orbiculata)]|nr:GNAT family N-acetyltransferase [Candidatus Thiodiazotropha taylori]